MPQRLALAGRAPAGERISEATSPEALRKHVEHADLPVDDVIAVADTVVVCTDPEPAAA